MKTADYTTDADTADAVLSELKLMNERLERIETTVVGLERRVESIEELREDVWPAVRGVAHSLNTRLVALEEAGALGFAKEAVGVAEKVATSFSPEEVHQLGESVVSILHTVKNLTQPEVLDVADRTATALRESEATDEKPRLFRAMRDPDVRRGMTRMLAVLRELGADHHKTEEATEPLVATN